VIKHLQKCLQLSRFKYPDLPPIKRKPNFLQTS
jgi:hypothetical protein